MMLDFHRTIGGLMGRERLGMVTMAGDMEGLWMSSKSSISTIRHNQAQSGTIRHNQDEQHPVACQPQIFVDNQIPQKKQ